MAAQKVTEKKAGQKTPELTEVQKKKLHIGKVGEHIKKLPEKKIHFDFIAAILTIPVLISVLILNTLALQKTTKEQKISQTPSPSPRYYREGTVYVTVAVTKAPPLPTVDQETCSKDIGQISISSPSENATVTTNPVCIGINYQQGKTCGAVWAYRINGSALSDYSNNSVCLHNLPEGENTFELFVKSLAGSSTQTLERNFIYHNPNKTATPTAPLSVTPIGSPTSAP